MTDETEKLSCLEFRKLFEKSETGGSVDETQLQALEKHASDCKSCFSYRAEILSIGDCCSTLPQFDVPEVLTQKILAATGIESPPPVSLPLTPIAIAALLAFLFIVPFDSLQDLYSWGVSIIGLYLLQMLIVLSNREEQTV